MSKGPELTNECAISEQISKKSSMSQITRGMQRESTVRQPFTLVKMTAHQRQQALVGVRRKGNTMLYG